MGLPVLRAECEKLYPIILAKTTSALKLIALVGISVEISNVLCPFIIAVAATWIHIHVLPTVGLANIAISSPGIHPTPVLFSDLKGVGIPIIPSPIFLFLLFSCHSEYLSSAKVS